MNDKQVERLTLRPSVLLYISDATAAVYSNIVTVRLDQFKLDRN